MMTINENVSIKTLLNQSQRNSVVCTEMVRKGEDNTPNIPDDDSTFNL